jgi:hypothetical protein
MDSVVHEQEHILLSEAIDEAYFMAVIALADIKIYFIRPQGAAHIPFIKFYKYFNILFISTNKNKEIKKDNEDLIKSIYTWLNQKEITERRMKDGIELFEQYQDKLFNAGIININRR